MKANGKNGHSSPTIDKGVPIPSRSGKPSGLAAVMRRLDINDSFLIGRSVDACRAAHSTARYVGIKVVTRKDGDGLRIWRVA